MSGKIVLVSATPFEIEPLVDFLKEKGTMLALNKFKIKDLEIDILISGIGLWSATYTLMDYLATHHPDGWIQIGIGGALDTSFAIGEVFQITSEEVYGEGAEQLDGTLLNPFALGWLDRNVHPYTNEQLLCPYYSTLAPAKGLTSFHAHGEEGAIQKLRQQVQGQIENMEGAPFFYISLMKKIPFLSIRSVSNAVEPRNTSKWNIPHAIQELNSQVIQLIEDSNYLPKALFKLRTD
jgi:futalosine hydrolase